MKKIYSFVVAVVAIVSCAFSANAQVTYMTGQITPADGSTLTSLKEICFYYPETENVVDESGYNGADLSDTDAGEQMIVVKKDGVEVGRGIEWDYTDDWLGVWIFFNEITEAGSYTVEVPAGTFIAYADDSMINPDLVLHYTIAGTNGIEGVEAEAPVVKGIYNLQGIRVNGDRNSLTPGIYVIDGKKVAVK